MTATMDPTCALIERASPAPGVLPSRRHAPRLRPHDVYVLELFEAVDGVLAGLLGDGCLVTDIRIGQSAAITLHRAPPRDYATGCVVARRSAAGGVIRRRRVVIDGVRVEWPIEPEG